MKKLHNEGIIWGTHGGIRKIDNHICEKTYEEYTLITIKDHVIDRYIFDTIKKLNLETFVKLYSYVFDNKRKQIISYIMEYYAPYIKDILRVPSRYIVDGFEKIYNDVIVLATNGILVRDMNFSNVIFGANGIKVIDFDNYKFSSTSFEETVKKNIIELCYCFKDNFKIALYNEYSRSGYIDNSINNNIRLFDPNSEDLISSIKKKVLRYDNMLEYFKDNTKI